MDVEEQPRARSSYGEGREQVFLFKNEFIKVRIYSWISPWADVGWCGGEKSLRILINFISSGAIEAQRVAWLSSNWKFVSLTPAVPAT